jgi:hypothetical protein
VVPQRAALERPRYPNHDLGVITPSWQDRSGQLRETTMNYVIAAAMLCFILPAFVLGGAMFVSRLRFKKAVGRVVGEDVVGNDTDQLSAPIVEFETPDGTNIVFTEKVHSNETIVDVLVKLAAGIAFKKDPNKVSVLYDPNKPHNARVNNFGNLYMVPLVLFAFGLLVMLSTIPGLDALLGKLTAVLDKIPF